MQIKPDNGGSVLSIDGLAIVQGDTLYASGTNAITRLTKSTGTTNFLKNSGTSNNPAWAQPATTDLSDVITWTDYSATSTIVGWSSFTTKQIWYEIIGKQFVLVFDLRGTSNSTTVTFTIPSTNISQISTSGILGGCENNGSFATTPGTVFSTTSSSTVTCAKDQTGAAFTNSGAKIVQGFIVIPIQ